MSDVSGYRNFDALLEVLGIEELVVRTFSDDDNILDHNEGELSDLLIKKGISISAINQIMKLHNFGYPLSISEAMNFSTNELREIVKECESLID